MSEFLEVYPAPAKAPAADEMREYGADTRVCGPQLWLYRAKANANGEGDVGFYFERYRAVRFTPRGVWVTDLPDYYQDPKLRWVSLDPHAGKRLAHLSKVDALYSLKRRNARQVSILTWQLERAQTVYAALNGAGK